MDTFTFEIFSKKHGIHTVTAPERFRAAIERLRWRVHYQRHRAPGCQFLAQAHTSTVHGEKGNISLHRFIWQLAGKPPTPEIDHLDGNPLNNAENNLRAATNAENQRNQRRQRNNSSGATGVVWDRNISMWRARVRVNGRCPYLGVFSSLVEAQIARDTAALKYHGAFAVLNSPPANDTSEMPALSPDEYRAILECVATSSF